MFLFWYYIHIPIKNIMSLRGMRKAKRSHDLETFQKGRFSQFESSRRLETRQAPKKENLKNLGWSNFLGLKSPKREIARFPRGAGILIF